MIVYEGESLTYTLPLMVGGGVVVPDEGSLSYTLYDHAGQVLHSETPTSPTITVDGTHHTLATGRAFEKRTLLVRFSFQGRPHSYREVYRVTPFINYSVTANDVRAFIGIDSQELPDDEVDIFKAYVSISSKVDLTTALNSGTLLELKANEAICMMAVLDVVPSLLQRVMYFEADGVLQFRRHSVKTFEHIEQAARARLDTLLAELTEEDPSIGSYDMLTLISSTQDMVTGA